MSDSAYKRKKASFYGEHLQEALKHDSPTLKSEDLPSFAKFFVNWDLIDRIKNNANQLITGRRGSGKTHLLGTFKEHIDEQNSNDIAIMISIMDVIGKMASPETMPDDPVFAAKKGAKDLFESFLRIFFDLFLEKITLYLECHIKPNTNKEKFNSLYKEVDDLLMRLMETIEFGREYPKLKKAKTTIKKIKNKGGALDGKADIGYQGGKINFDAGISLKGNTGTVNEKESVIEIESMLCLDIYEVRKLVIKILEVLKIKTLYILIDEWMEIDKITPSNKQAHFAQLIKQLFFNNNLIAIKVASVWHETTLYDKKDLSVAVGVQLNHDIIRDVDLDTAFLLNESEIYNFSKELLFKRLAHICEEIKFLQVGGIIDDVFIEEIFDNYNNFKAFIASSHGIPRDMMNMFHKCSLQINRDFKKYCINYQVIAEQSKKVYNVDKRKNINVNSSAYYLLKLINTHLEKTGKRLFIVENGQVYESYSLRKLIDEELVHQIPSGVTHRCIMDSYKGFHIDFGNFVDWVSAKRKDIETILNESVIPYFSDDFESKFEDYIINVSQIEDDILKCLKCDKQFHAAHPVYKKNSLCPSCGEKII